MSDFPEILKWVLVHEGGWADHPADPGGQTMKGVTQRVYSAYRERHGLPVRSVREIEDDELVAIYRRQYWDVVRGDDLPAGLDYAVFDFAVNSGPGRAAKFLQALLGVDQDGQIGERTLAALNGTDTATLIVKLCDDRLAWLKRLPTWKTFGRGWTTRVNGVRDGALRRFRGLRHATEAPAEAAPKADGPVSKASTLADVLSTKEGLAVVAPVATAAIGTAATGNGPVQYAMAAVIVIAAIAGAFFILRRRA